MGTMDVDFVVIGSGPNGLVAACALARQGCRVLVLEAHPEHPGGAVWSDEGTLPGFLHDVGAGFFSFGKISPAFHELDLEGRGIVWRHLDFESAHPAPDGSHAAIARDADRNAREFVGPRSAGANPGPACYGARGPLTLTDVNLLLGRLVGRPFRHPGATRAGPGASRRSAGGARAAHGTVRRRGGACSKAPSPSPTRRWPMRSAASPCDAGTTPVSTRWSASAARAASTRAAWPASSGFAG